MQYLGKIENLRDEFTAARKANVSPHLFYRITETGEVYAYAWDELPESEQNAIEEYIKTIKEGS